MAKFEIAIGPVLENEGGYVNNPNDPGGETKYGISKRQYPGLDIKNLSLEDAKGIYRKDYWQFDEIEDQTIADKLLDMAVNMGVGTAVRLLQSALNLPADGVFGPKTKVAVNGNPPEKTLQLLRFYAVVHYLDLISKNAKLAKFKRGWLIRAVA